MHFWFFFISATLFFSYVACDRVFFLTLASIALAVWAVASSVMCKSDLSSQGRISRNSKWMCVECVSFLLVTLVVWQWEPICYFYYKHSVAFYFSDEAEKTVAKLPIFPFEANQPIDPVRYKQVNDSLDNATTDEFLGRIKVGATVFTAVSSIESMFAGSGPFPLGCGHVVGIDGMYAPQFPRPLYGIYVTIDPECDTDTLPTDVRRQRFHSFESLLVSHYGKPHYVAGDSAMLAAWKFGSRMVALTYVAPRNALEGDRFAIIQCSTEGYNELCALAKADDNVKAVQASGGNDSLQSKEKARKKRQNGERENGDFLQRHL